MCWISSLPSNFWSEAELENPFASKYAKSAAKSEGEERDGNAASFIFVVPLLHLWRGL